MPADRPLTTPLIWQGGQPPPWIGSLGLGEIESPGALFALRGDPAAVSQLRDQRPDALIVAVVEVCTPALEIALLDAGASLVVDGTHPALDRRRIQAVARPRRRARSRMRALELSVGLMQAANDEDEFIRRLTHTIADELASRRVSIMQVDPERVELVMRAAVGIPAEVIAHARTPIGQGIAGVSAQIGEPIYVDDHAQVRAGGVTAQQLAKAAPGTPMSLTVPIKNHGQVVGVVNITDRHDGQPYTPRDIDFIDALTRQAGFLLENARLMSGLARLKAFNESVIDTIDDPLVVVDGRGRIAAVNRCFRSCFRGDRGDGLRETLPLSGPQQAVLDALLAGEAVPLEARMGWPIARRVYDISAQPFESEELPLTLVVLRDITDKADRERRLLSAEKMASLGVLASGIAHEINNPVAYAKANTRTLGEYVTDLLQALDAWRAAAHSGDLTAARAAEAELGIASLRGDLDQIVREIIEGIERVERIVKSLKSFAHPDTEKARPASLNALIESAVLLTQGKWKRALVVSLELAPDLPGLACLPTQLEQVFMNLIVNAAQAAGEGAGRQLQIATAATAEGLQVTFTDDCGGIPDDVRERIFEPFFTTKDIGEGSGLGLAISRNIVVGHGGTLDLTVRPGEGSTFTVSLPLGEAGRPMVVKQLSRYRA